MTAHPFAEVLHCCNLWKSCTLLSGEHSAFREPRTLAVNCKLKRIEASHNIEGTMMQIIVLLASLVVLTSPAVAASTPGDLVQELTRAAHSSDIEGFLAAMSADTRHAMAEAEAARSTFVAAQKDFLAALDERFGVGPTGGGQSPIAADRKTVLSRFVDIELIGVDQKTANEARLRLKTVTKGSGDRIVTEEDTFPAVEESGEWKLDLTGLTRGRIQIADQRAAAYKQVAQKVRAGAFKDRSSALIAFVKAQRAHPAGGTEK
jgi:hypothetical protein